ncbi:MAG: class I SAM-dependent methyltransferase, partial [Acidobacteriota bacterium]|nr:class I SAM-dependent methyltransferase [Acidobacteriota bacterium]
SRLLDIPISARQVQGDSVPSWRRASVESKALATRLRKNLRRLRPWARRKQVTCYRLYDADVPQYNVAIDWYDGSVRVEEHPRPRKVPHADADRHLRDTLLVVSELLKLDTSAIVVRSGGWQRPVQPEAGSMNDHDAKIVEEWGSRFEVNLQDPWNTGLDLEHRLLRRRVREQSARGDFLNLFGGTCTASVAAALGGARSSTSVDRSSRRLTQGRRNFTLNKLTVTGHHFTRSDVCRWLTLNGHRRYDLILLAPPGDFRTQPTSTDVERQQGHVNLIRQVGGMLKISGELLFASTQKGFDLTSAQLDKFVVKEITHELTSADFERRPRLRVWSIHRNGAGGV